MAEASDRFDECLAIVRLAFQGEPFTYNGKYLRVPREIRLRPPTLRLDKCSSARSASQAVEQSLPRLSLSPMLTGHLPLEAQRQILTAWDETTHRLAAIQPRRRSVRRFWSWRTPTVRPTN